MNIRQLALQIIAEVTGRDATLANSKVERVEEILSCYLQRLQDEDRRERLAELLMSGYILL